VLPTLRCLTNVLERSQDRLGEMKALLSIIQSSVNKIEEGLTANAAVLPPSNTPYSLESESPLLHPSVQSAGALITSAAAQLMTLVAPAPLVIGDMVTQVNRIIVVAVTHFSDCYKALCYRCNAYCSEHSCCRDPSRCGPRGNATYPFGYSPT
jgi:hypothetical protein